MLLTHVMMAFDQGPTDPTLAVSEGAVSETSNHFVHEALLIMARNRSSGSRPHELAHPGNVTHDNAARGGEGLEDGERHALPGRRLDHDVSGR